MRSIKKFATADIGPRAVADRTFRFCLSSSRVDLVGDSLSVEGWDLDAYRKNPIVLYNHSTDKPIGRCTGLEVVGQKLYGNICFAPASVNEFADQIYRMVANSFIKAVSVGFVPIRGDYASEPGRHINYSAMRLLEVSVCPLPANPDALIVASMRRKGIDTERFLTLTTSGTIVSTPIDPVERQIQDIRAKARQDYERTQRLARAALEETDNHIRSIRAKARTEYLLNHNEDIRHG